MKKTVLNKKELFLLIMKILTQYRTSDFNAKCVAEALISAEIDNQKGHGISRLPSYVAQLKTGKLNGLVKPEVIDKKLASLRIDAKNGFAFSALSLAIEEASNLVKETGVVAISIFNSNHCGQAGYHVEKLANLGLVSMLFSNTPKAIAPWGGEKPIFGTNPIAFASPRLSSPPLVIDLSLSKVARGKIMFAKQQGTTIPEDWALNAKGEATTNPNEALKGSMLPIGDQKGAALALMIEILTAALGGSNFGYEASSFFDGKGRSPGVGQLLLVFDPKFFSSNNFLNRVESLLMAMLEQDGVRIPGNNRIIKRDNFIDKIEIENKLYKELNDLLKL